MSAKVLQESTAKLRSELIEARRSHAAGELSNTRKIRELRKEIAKSLTYQRQKKDTKEQDS